MSVRIDGIERLRAKVVSLRQSSRASAATMARELAGNVLAEMQRRIPVDSGRGLQALTIEKVDRDTYEVGPEKGQHGDPEVYLRFVEFGTIHQPPQPFMRPAVDVVRSRVEPIAKQVISKTLK